MNILGRKVILRAIEPKDLPFMLDMINDPEIEKMVGGWSFPTSEKQQQDWYNRVIGDKNNLRFTIEYEGRFVGISTLGEFDWKNRTAFHGIKLHSSAPKGVGLGTDAVYATMKYAFEELQLHRLEGKILDYNIPSRKLYEKCGWKFEGCYRSRVFKGNAYHDEWPNAILRDEYFEWKEKFMAVNPSSNDSIGWVSVIINNIYINIAA